MSYLTELEKQQLHFDWRYKGVSILNLLTESEANSIGRITIVMTSFIR